MTELPNSFKERMSVILKEEFSDYVNSLDAPPSKALHINCKKTNCDILKLLPFAAEKLPAYDNGYTFSFDKPGNLPIHHAGAFYVQEPSAMMPIASLVPFLYGKNIKVLDMCASPGGKTSQAHNLCGRDSVIFSNEIIPSRCKTLVGNIERLGYRNSAVINADTDFLASAFPGEFGLVICDAPCSGEGMFRKNSAAIDEWSEENVRICAERQRHILENAAACCAVGGYLLYSTCTFSVEENEKNISAFLKDHEDFEAVLPDDSIRAHTDCGIEEYCKGFDKECARRLYPHKCCGEGQFFVILKRNGTLCESNEFSYKDSSRLPDKKELSAINSFIDENLEIDGCEIRIYGENILILPSFMKIPPKHVFSCGVKLGELKNSRIVPHHQLFSAYGDKFIRKVEIGGDNLLCEKYFHGEGFEVNIPGGWCAVTVHECPAGGGKVVDGVLKNHYPKGLRIL